MPFVVVPRIAFTPHHSSRTYRFDGVRDGLGQRTGVADARHASESDGVEPECGQGGLDSALPQVIRDDARSGGQARFDVRRDGQTGFHGVLG